MGKFINSEEHTIEASALMDYFESRKLNRKEMACLCQDIIMFVNHASMFDRLKELAQEEE